MDLELWSLFDSHVDPGYGSILLSFFISPHFNENFSVNLMLQVTACMHVSLLLQMLILGVGSLR